MKNSLNRKQILPFLLSFLLLLTASCEAASPVQTPPTTTEAITTAPPESISPAESETAEVTDGSETTQDPNAQYTVSVVNGSIDGSATEGTYTVGTALRLSAVTPQKGYGFSHWEDGDGNRIGDAEQIEITVSKSTVYKAYYHTVFGEYTTTGRPVMTDLSKDWQQGGINGDLKVFNTSDKSRISFARPLLLKKGEVLTVSIPSDPWSCPFAGSTNGSKVPCEDGCTIAIAKMILRKNGDKETGNFFTDYTLLEKANWNMGGFQYVAKSDVYVMITVKYDKHGGLAFHTGKSVLRDMQITVSTTEEMSAHKPVGSYWEPELQDAVQKIEANRKKLGSGVSEFFFLTDIHWKDYNMQFSPALINYLAERLNAYHVILGGDIIERNATREGAINEELLPFFSAMADYTKAGEALKIFSTLGNHDRNYLSYKPNTALCLSDEDVYRIFIERTEGWAVSPEGNPYCSYYDDTANKVRYLQFAYAADTVDLAVDLFDETLTWVEEQILSLDSDWTVVLVTHGVFDERQNSWAETVKSRVLRWQASSDNKIAVWITGHIHYDKSEILVSADGSAAVRVISLNCDSYGKLGANTVQMNFSTATEQSFSFIQIDTKTQTIHLTRIGAGKDLTFTYGSAMQDEYVAAPHCSIRVVNGTVNGKYYASVRNGTRVTLKADTPPAGYEFSCWKNLRGEVVGNTPTLALDVTESTQYKPYYVDVDPTNDITVPNAVKTDLANDWTHGGMGNTLGEWWLDNEHHDTRTSFAEPIFLKKGQTITVKLPPIDCPTGTCVGGCSLATLIAAMDKTGESETGYLPHEYTIHYLKWSMSYTATKDTYVSILVKYNKHGHDDFSVANEEMQGVVITVTP